jgi:hypothetical protein
MGFLLKKLSSWNQLVGIGGGLLEVGNQGFLSHSRNFLGLIPVSFIRPPDKELGSFGFAVMIASFGGVYRIYTPPKLETFPPISKEPEPA